MNQEYSLEATALCKYLVKDEGDRELQASYTNAIKKLNLQYLNDEEKIATWMIKYPIIIGPIDSVMGIVNPKGNIRSRIHLMFTLLECHPKYTHHFINTKHNNFSLVKFIYYGISSVISLIIGRIILFFLRWK